MNEKVEEPEKANIWEGDLLGREEDAKYLLRFLVNRVQHNKGYGRQGAYVLNLDAEWGQGKTFFMKRFAKEIAQAHHPVISINAWEDDFGDDPFTVVMSEIDAYVEERFGTKGLAGTAKKAFENLRKNYREVMVATLQGVAKRGATWAIGKAADEVVDILAGETADGSREADGADTDTKQERSKVDAAAAHVEDFTLRLIDRYAQNRIAAFKQGQKSLRLFRDSLSVFVEKLGDLDDLKPPLFILVDELDRCRPPYALAMLERIKHLFDVPNVVFVMATDTKQLTASISAVYGQDFDGARYLQRFFNRGYTLPQPSRRRIIELAFETGLIDGTKLKSPGHENDNIGILTSGGEAFGMSIRALEQALDILGSLTVTWEGKLLIQTPLMFALIVNYMNGADMDDFGAPDSWLINTLKGIKNWTAIHKGQFRGFRGYHATVDIAVYTQSLAIKSREQLSEVAFQGTQGHAIYEDVDGPKLANIYVQEVLQQDYNVQVSGIRRHDAREPVSSLRLYPQLIRQAGRLTSVNAAS